MLMARESLLDIWVGGSTVTYSGKSMHQIPPPAWLIGGPTDRRRCGALATLGRGTGAAAATRRRGRSVKTLVGGFCIARSHGAARRFICQLLVAWRHLLDAQFA